MKVQRLIMVETGTYNDMVVRPYQSNLNEQTMNVFRDVTMEGRNLSSETLSGLASNILRPSGQVRGAAMIENGWENRRLRFMLEVMDESTFGAFGNIHICTGYTDHVGVSHGGYLDPNMRLYFNNHIKIRQSMHSTPAGQALQQAVASANQILPGNRLPQTYGFQQQPQSQLQFLMRPEDVVNSMFANSLNSADVVDLRATNTTGMKQSRRDNGLAPVYLSRTLKALNSAYQQESTFGGAGVEDVYERAAGAIREETLNADNFFGQLMMQTDLLEQNFITYGEFCRIFPEADHLNNVIMKGEVQKMQNPNTMAVERGSTETWNGSTNETIAATILSHSVPAMMMDNMITGLVFHATNQTMNGQVEVQVNDARSFSQHLDVGPYLQHLVERIKTEVLRDVTHNNEMDINLSMSVDVLGDTMITISVAGGPFYDYVMPSFCDALVAPVIGGNDQDLRTIGHDLETLYGGVGTLHQPIDTSSDFGMSDFSDNNPGMGGSPNGEIDSLI